MRRGEVFGWIFLPIAEFIVMKFFAVIARLIGQSRGKMWIIRSSRIMTALAAGLTMNYEY
jgi:hypothetical protein